MAYNSYQSTYTTHRVPLIGNPTLRIGNSILKDALFTNFYAVEIKEPGGSKYYLEQRPGLVYQSAYTTGQSGVGRGIYAWNGSVFTVVDNRLNRNNGAIQTLTTSTGAVGFQEFANGVNQRFLVVLDGISGWVIKEDFTITKITDADFPSPHCVHAGYMDGYIFVAKSGTADIYNCNLEDATLWTAGDFISAETFPDPVVALCRQNNYIVAVGTQTTEFFYDTGVFPGTPLARNSAALHQVGTPAPDTVIQIEEQVVFLAQTQIGGRTVVVFNGFNPSEISTEVVRQSLDAEGTNVSNAKAFIVRSKGRKFYVLNLMDVSWVFDFDTQMWHQWSISASGPFGCNYASDSPNGYPLLLSKDTGNVFGLVAGVSKDSTTITGTTNIISTVITDKMDFGTMNRKFMSRWALIYDTPSGNNITTLSLSWTDDDYQTYSTPRTINLSNTMATTVQLGMFRRRAFKLVYADAFPIRLEGFEVDINAGTQ